MEEQVKQQQQTQQQTQEPQGWKDVTLNPGMPVAALIEFLNVLNSRLINIEDNFVFKHEDKEMTLTEFYAIEAAKQMQQAQEQAQAKADKAN